MFQAFGPVVRSAATFAGPAIRAGVSEGIKATTASAIGIGGFAATIITGYGMITGVEFLHDRWHSFRQRRALRPKNAGFYAAFGNVDVQDGTAEPVETPKYDAFQAVFHPEMPAPAATAESAAAPQPA